MSKTERMGNKEAMDMIAALQKHGAGGWCRIADGPDQVHMMALGMQVIRALVTKLKRLTL